MTNDTKRELKELQDDFMKQYADIESNPDDCKNFQSRLDNLDEKAEYIRCLLESRWDE